MTLVSLRHSALQKRGGGAGSMREIALARSGVRRLAQPLAICAIRGGGSFIALSGRLLSVEAPAPMIWTPGAMAERIRTLERALREVLKEIQPLPYPVPKQVTVSVPLAAVPVAIEQADLFYEIQGGES